MNRSLVSWMAMIVCGSWLLGGCDNPPGPICTPDGTAIKSVAVQDDPLEVAAVTAAERARADYRQSLKVLEGYYTRVGNKDKLDDATGELKNLDQAQYFNFVGINVTPRAGESIEGADERLLVEQAVADRNRWLASLDRLLKYYRDKGKTLEARLIENVQARFDPVYRYTFFLEAEIPGPELRPTRVDPEADALYDRAHKLFLDGKGPLHFFVTTSYPKERQAFVLFRELIQKHPDSTKIALSAYFIGEILKEYFNENVRAVKWYERAWQWDPHITEPARFQAATIYDIRLKDYPHAVECYRASLEEDPWRLLNPETARRRIEELTGKAP